MADLRGTRVAALHLRLLILDLCSKKSVASALKTRSIKPAAFGPFRVFRGKNRFIVLALSEGATRTSTKNGTLLLGCHFEMIEKFFKELVSATEFLESGNSFVEHIKSGAVADADTMVITKCNTWDCSHTVAVEQLVTKIH